jgi:NNP family nitrate/nitrite transporter-like MFS transporter
MACGATYAVVPLVRPNAIGSVSGIVGAGGNVGAVLAGFVFKEESISPSSAFFILGITATLIAFSAFLLRFPERDEEDVLEPVRGGVATLNMQVGD